MDTSSASSSVSSSTLTSSQDPSAQRSRVFLGNLNTAQMSRPELEQRFSRYGRVTGVSIHKGFGFVQFGDERSARAAVQGEDGQVYYGMRVDANIASEPKVRRAGSGSGPAGGTLGVGQPALKRPRQDLPPGGSVVGGGGSGGGGVGSLQTLGGPRKTSNLVSLVTPSNPVPEVQPEKRPTLNDPSVKDLLVCGNCKEVLPNLDGMQAHKLAGCRLRLVCRCLQTGEPAGMDCAYCGAEFASAWGLLLHCRDEHDLALFASAAAGSSSSSTATTAITTAAAAAVVATATTTVSSSCSISSAASTAATVVAGAPAAPVSVKSEANGQ